MRVTFCLPVTSGRALDAAYRIVKDIGTVYGGNTYSLLETPVFVGYWDQAVDLGVEPIDDIAFLFVDLPSRELADPAFDNELETLGRFVSKAYAEAGAPQDEVWIGAEPLALSISRIGNLTVAAEDLLNRLREIALEEC